MFSTYYKVDGNLELKFSNVLTSYLKSWFFFDFIACIPFDNILKFFYF